MYIANSPYLVSLNIELGYQNASLILRQWLQLVTHEHDLFSWEISFALADDPQCSLQSLPFYMELHTRREGHLIRLEEIWDILSLIQLETSGLEG